MEPDSPSCSQSEKPVLSRGIISRGAIRLLEIAHLHERSGAAISFHSSPEMPAPRLALETPGGRAEFLSSLAALLRGPASPDQFQGGPYFRDCSIEPLFPRAAFAFAIVFQAILIAYPPPIWNLQTARTVSAAPPAEISWYGPVKDFPAILPMRRTRRTAVPKQPSKTQPQRGADAFHPRQTILSEPLHPTHPRQTLVQPKAPQEPPKILPALPNIVELASAQPERPRLRLTANELTPLRPKAHESFAATNVAAPEIAAMEKQAGAISIASSQKAPAKPLLPVNPMSAPRAASPKAEANAAAPDIAGRTMESETLIALSASPAPAAPPAIPAGNLSAHVAISPDGPKPGAPVGAPSGEAAGEGNSNGAAGHGPEGIFISGGNSANTGPVSGLSLGPASHSSGRPVLSPALPRARAASEGSNSLAADAQGAAQSAPKLGMLPQEVLGSKRVYTLHVNMPNLTSAVGSWVLNFAELKEAAPGGSMKPGASELAGPVPLRKVDPKYPPELRAAHVDGDVVLYAIIRKDGSVDSIQLVHSVDPQLDANAMEALAQWKFTPAEKHGEPVDLEAVVHIPFRSRGPAF
jgi:TonB family protein